MKQFDWILFAALICLILFGEMVIFSASVLHLGEKSITYDYYIKQLFWIAIAAVLFMVVLFIPQILIDMLIVPAYIFSLLFLLTVLFLPAIKDVHRWINIAGVSFQPSEFAKFFTLLLIAKVITRKNLSEYKKILYAFLIIIPPVLLILKEPDLGNALVLSVCIIPMLYYAGVSLFIIFILMSPLLSILVGFSPVVWIIFDLILLLILLYHKLGIVQAGFILAGNAFLSFLAPFFWKSLRGYQQVRILTFLNPSRDVLGGGYQIIQSKIAIGSGGILGKGFLEGTQKNLNFLPEQQTDFIFSVIGEEFGFFGCILLLCLLLVLIYRGFVILKKNKNLMKKTMIIGILSLIILEIIVNIGMNIGIIPVVGIPLPFISYGGSSLIINIIAITFLLKFEKERSFVYS